VLTFEWDDAKNEANSAKHAIAIEEAADEFIDPLSVTVPAPDHSIDEQRFGPNCDAEGEKQL